MSLPFQLLSLTSLLILFALSLSYYILLSIQSWWRLRAFKGPPTASFSYLWIIRACQSGNMGDWFKRATKEYGNSATSSTVRIGPNDLLTADPEVIRRMATARSRYTRSNWYAVQRVGPGGDSMFSHLDTAAHDKVKAKTAAGYSGKEVPGLEGRVDDTIAQLVGKIRTKYAASSARGLQQQHKPFLDLAMMVQYFTLDSITKIGFGEEFGYIRSEEDVYGYIALVTRLASVVTLSANVPYLANIMSSTLVLNLMAPKITDKSGVGRVFYVTKEMVQERWAADDKSRNDILVRSPFPGSWMRHGLSQPECETEVLFQLVAGSDTTATALRTTLLHIITSPRVCSALQAEIDQGIRDGRISSPITNAESLRLPYLQAVIYEGLRMCPPFNGLVLKVVPPEGDSIDGVFVPGGTRIGHSVDALLRDTAVFGEDAELFRPERWVEAADEAAVAEMRRVTELVFGYGRWACAGKNIAFLEMNKVYVELLRVFDFQIVYPARPWTSVNRSLWLQQDMWVRVTERH
ncbi:cytochrome P450 monooxygenase [Podospora appendiculata]|uniref:Cytochrome P450 monooxygenase ABA1 n=1 Tax=Podospora appendiculata TaxID=314037 RepID=A0AAE1CIN4_9PEZI|nr:cytochrome P450 monooxygenase [Podospora appendiculata]